MKSVRAFDLTCIRRSTIVFLCLAGLMTILLVHSTWENIRGFFSYGLNDFTTFYVAAELIGTPQLYDVQANLDAQHRLVNKSGLFQLYLRLPYFAALLRPLTRLRYADAVLVWKAVLLAALAAFVVIFPCAPKRLNTLALCCSLPASSALLFGQDEALPLVWIALALRLRRAERSFLGGCILALCAEKFHLFLLLPLLLVGKREWRMAAGLGAGACAIIASCFVIQGPSFLLQYYYVLGSRHNAMPWTMTNFAGTFWFLPRPELAGLLLAVPVFVCVGLICRRSSFEVGFAACILGGLVSIVYGGIYDWTIAIPALLILHIAVPTTRLATLMLGSPLLTIPVLLSPIRVRPSWISCTLTVAVACLALWEVLRATVAKSDDPQPFRYPMLAIGEGQ